MNIDLELYKVFYVAKNKHMTKASEELHISQPAISQSIKKLENQLGGTLFLRSNKGMQLTNEGKMFYEYVKGALELINNAENEFTSFKGLSKGEIKIGCSTTLTKIILLDVIKRFHQDYPNISINITNDLTSNLINDLKLGKLDFVIFNESNIKETNLHLEKITELKQGFIYNPDYFKDDINNFEDLNNYPLILQKESSNSRKLINSISSKNNTILIPKMEVVSQELVTEFTNIGLGIGFTIIDLVKKNFNNLKELKINKDIPKINVYLGTNKSILPTFASSTFIKYLKRFIHLLINLFNSLRSSKAFASFESYKSLKKELLFTKLLNRLSTKKYFNSKLNPSEFSFNVTFLFEYSIVSITLILPFEYKILYIIS